MTATKEVTPLSGTQLFLYQMSALPGSDATIARLFGRFLRKVAERPKAIKTPYRLSLREVSNFAEFVTSVFALNVSTPPEDSLHDLANKAYLGPDGGFILRCNTEADPNRTMVLEVIRPTHRR